MFAFIIASIIITIIVFVALSILYYGIVIQDLSFGEYKSKREFLLDLIPFRKWVVPLIDKFEKLE